MNRMTSLLSAALLVMGLLLPVSAQTAQKSTEETLFDFEPDGKMAFDQAKDCNFVTEHATKGKHAAKQDLKDKSFGIAFGMNANYNFGGHWQEFDRLGIDVFVEGGGGKFYGFFRDDQAKDWATRFNFEQVLQPGKRKVEIPMGSITREAGGKPLNLDKLQWVSLNFSSNDPAAPATIYLGRSEER